MPHAAGGPNFRLVLDPEIFKHGRVPAHQIALAHKCLVFHSNEQAGPLIGEHKMGRHIEMAQALQR